VDVLSDVRMENCTVAGNSALNGGGGVYAFDGSHADDTMKPVGVGRLFGCLVLGNVSGTPSAGTRPDDINIHYSTNADKDPDPSLGPWVPRYDGQIESAGYNLVGTVAEGDSEWFTRTGDRTGLALSAVLACLAGGAGDLRDNGGLVRTVAPLADGPAGDSIPSGTAGLPATDARGVPRPQGLKADAGACELNGDGGGGGCDAGTGTAAALLLLGALPLLKGRRD